MFVALEKSEWPGHPVRFHVSCRESRDMGDFQDYGHMAFHVPDPLVVARRSGLTPVGPVSGGRGWACVEVEPGGAMELLEGGNMKELNHV